MPSAAWWHELAAGGVAGVGSRLVTYPLDTLKAQQQVWGELARLGGRPAGRAPRAPGAGGGGGGAVLQMDLAGAARRVWRAEGARGFYRGFGAVAVGTVPANALYFAGYEASKASLPAGIVPPGAATHAAAGLAAQALAGVAFTPMDVVKERMQTQQLALESGAAGATRYAHAGEALSSLLAREGVAGGLFKGYGATLAVWGPWTMLYFVGYEAAKEGAAKRLGVHGGADALPAWACAGSAAVASAAACVATHALDTAKTRLQALPGGGRSFRSALRGLWCEGVGAMLTAGLAARTINGASTSAISFYLYESAKKWLRRPEEEEA